MIVALVVIGALSGVAFFALLGVACVHAAQDAREERLEREAVRRAFEAAERERDEGRAWVEQAEAYSLALSDPDRAAMAEFVDHPYFAADDMLATEAQAFLAAHAR